MDIFYKLYFGFIANCINLFLLIEKSNIFVSQLQKMYSILKNIKMNQSKNISRLIFKGLGFLLIGIAIVLSLLYYLSYTESIPLFMIKNRGFMLSVGTLIVIFSDLKKGEKSEDEMVNLPKTKNSILFWGFFKGTLTNEQIIEAIEKLKKIAIWIVLGLLIGIIILRLFSNS